MFGLDFAVDGVLDQFCDWIYGKLITFFGEFFSMINMMGAELFELDWIKAILLFFCMPNRYDKTPSSTGGR